jgi:hypothetical protein
MKRRKTGKRTVIGPFDLGWKSTPRKLIGFEMILKACATVPLAGARFIGAGAVLFVLFKIAVHSNTS